jgi:hypothetical protein
MGCCSFAWHGEPVWKIAGFALPFGLYAAFYLNRDPSWFDIVFHTVWASLFSVLIWGVVRVVRNITDRLRKHT